MPIMRTLMTRPCSKPGAGGVCYNRAMTTSPKRPRRQRAASRLRRERTLFAAALWSAGVTVLVALGIFVAQWTTPGTALRNLIDLELYNRAVRPDNPLMARFLTQVQTQEALYFTPLTMLCGGLALGCLAPRAAGKRRVLGAALKVGLTVLALCLLTSWGESLYAQGWHLRPHEIDRELLLVQGGLLLGWTAVYLLGTLLGLWARDRKQPVAAHAPPPP